jgi:hypothetical protein
MAEERAHAWEGQALYRPSSALLLLLLPSPSLRPFCHSYTCSELAFFSSSSQSKFEASFFFFSSSSFALLQLSPPLQLLQLEVNLHSPHLYLNDAHDFFLVWLLPELSSLCAHIPLILCVSLSLSLSSFSLCRPLSVHSLCVFLFVFFWACFSQIITSLCKIELQ